MQIGQRNDMQNAIDKQKIPSMHANDWTRIDNGKYVALLHVPSSTLFEISPNALISKSCDRDDSCPLCLFERQVKVPKKLAPKTDISAIALNVVESCNLRCSYCFAGDGDYGEPSFMSLEIAKQAIQYFVRDRSDLHIIFFGGEPLLNFDLIEKIVKWCESHTNKRFSYGITTNGVLLKQSNLSFFKKYNFALKISYDGPLLQAKQRFGTTNKLSLGLITEKKLEKYSEALSRLRGLKIRATICSDSLPQAYDNIISLLNSQTYRFAFARASLADESLKFSRKDIEKLNSILENIVDYYLDNNEFHSLLRLSNLNKFIGMIHRGDYHRNYCGAGINYLSISTSGRFYLCHRFTEDSEECLGNLDEGLDLNKVKKISELRAGDTEPCRSCWMRNFCGGGCFHEHKTANGSITKIDPMFCLLQDAELRQSVRVYLYLKHEAPELLDKL